LCTVFVENCVLFAFDINICNVCKRSKIERNKNFRLMFGGKNGLSKTSDFTSVFANLYALQELLIRIIKRLDFYGVKIIVFLDMPEKTV
jgi:hypothetical protein